MYHTPTEEVCRRYTQRIREIPILSVDEEYMHAKNWRDKQDKNALDRLINSHLRLVMKVAYGYKGYGLPIPDLIAEGNLGILQATKHFDPDRGIKFSTYSTWWIKANIQEYILRSWSLVKMGTTNAQKKLFFGLRRLKRTLDHSDESSELTADKVNEIATQLNVSVEDVISMHQRMYEKDTSLNATVKQDSDSESEWIDWVSDTADSQEYVVLEEDERSKKNKLLEMAFSKLKDREQYILKQRRLLEDPKTLEDLATELSLSRERVRQIEIIAFDKLKKAIKTLSYDMDLHF